jgi:hypothetical protein
MTFIDWSDSEGMFALLVDFVADEGRACVADGEREHFLAHLLRDLTAIEQQISTMPPAQVIHALREVRDGLPHAFADDPVVLHVDACIEELERVHAERRGAGPGESRGSE